MHLNKNSWAAAYDKILTIQRGVCCDWASYGGRAFKNRFQEYLIRLVHWDRGFETLTKILRNPERSREVTATLTEAICRQADALCESDAGAELLYSAVKLGYGNVARRVVSSRRCVETFGGASAMRPHADILKEAIAFPGMRAVLTITSRNLQHYRARKPSLL